MRSSNESVCHADGLPTIGSSAPIKLPPQVSEQLLLPLAQRSISTGAGHIGGIATAIVPILARASLVGLLELLLSISYSNRS